MSEWKTIETAMCCTSASGTIVNVPSNILSVTVFITRFRFAYW